MNPIATIRSLYTPIQPAVRHAVGEVIYCEHLPRIELQSFIYCYWELKTTVELSGPFTYRVVCDGCIDVFFELTECHDSFVMGFCRKYTEFHLGNSFHYIGIRFLPTAFTQIFGVDSSELSNRYQSLQEVAPEVTADISSRFSGMQTGNNLVTQLDELMMEHIHHSEIDYDSRLYDAIACILDNYGVINVEVDLNIGVSQRQLRRLFKFYIGESPKAFSNVVRFQNILRAKPSGQSLRRNKLFYDFGYFDQSHFIKDFKTFYGVTPSVAFGRD